MKKIAAAVATAILHMQKTNLLRREGLYSHSMVAAGFLTNGIRIQLIAFRRFMMREEMLP